jgi:hypothetical protein
MNNMIDVTKLAKRVDARWRDESLENGDGLVVTLGEGTDNEPLLAAMPWKLYDALRAGLSCNPSAIDPTRPPEHESLSTEQLFLLAAFMKLELGFCVEDINAELRANLKNDV